MYNGEEQDRYSLGIIAIKSGQDVEFLHWCMLLKTKSGGVVLLLMIPSWYPNNPQSGLWDGWVSFTNFNILLFQPAICDFKLHMGPYSFSPLSEKAWCLIYYPRIIGEYIILVCMF